MYRYSTQQQSRRRGVVVVGVLINQSDVMRARVRRLHVLRVVLEAADEVFGRQLANAYLVDGRKQWESAQDTYSYMYMYM